VNLDVTADIKDVTKMLKGLNTKTEAAASRALNKTIASAKTQATRTISKETGIKPQKKVREVLVVSKARRTKLVAVLEAKPRVFNLIEFVSPSRRNSRSFRKNSGVTAKAWGRSKLYPRTFVGRGRSSGKMLVFKRTSSKPSVPKEVKGPSVPRSFVQRKIQQAIVRRAEEQWLKNYQHEINREISKI